MDQITPNETNEEISTPKIMLKDNSKRAEYLLIVFWIVIGGLLLGLIPGFNEIILLDKLNNGEFVEDSAIDLSDTIQVTVGLIQTILYIISAVVFLNWYRRAYGNLNRLHIKTEYEEQMVGWYFAIPILSLFRPYQVVSEIWEKTQNYLKSIKSNYMENNNSFFIGLWWGLFILSNFIGNFIFKSIFKDDTLENYIIESQALIVSDVIQIIEGLFVIYIVRNISKMETEVAKHVKRNGGIILR